MAPQAVVMITYGATIQDKFTKSTIFCFQWETICKRPNPHIQQCTCPISHKASYKTDMCTFLFWTVHCGIWCRRIVGCVRLVLNHWGGVTHICVGNLTIIASDNDLSPGRRQAIIWTNAGILLIEPLGTISMQLPSKFIHFHSRKCIWKCRQEYGGHNVSTSMCRRFCSAFSEFTAAFTVDLMPVGCESLVASVPVYIFQNSALPACPEYYFLLVCTEPSGICSTIKKAWYFIALR